MKTIITTTALIVMLGVTYIFSANAAEKIPMPTRMAALSISNNVNASLKADVKKNLQLQTSIPGKLDIPDKYIHWTISRKGGAILKSLSGHVQMIDLPSGLYTVKLSIGKFVTEKDIHVRRGQHIQPYFKAELASLSLSSNQVVDWLLTGSDGRKFLIKQKSQLRRLLPADNYTVQATLRDMPLQKQIQLQPGQQVKNELNIPVGQVKLIATRGNQPLFKPIKWKVYRLRNKSRQQVGEYNLHSQLVSIPPGYYEAVAEYNGNARKRKFWVQHNTVNSIILAMD